MNARPYPPKVITQKELDGALARIKALDATLAKEHRYYIIVPVYANIDHFDSPNPAYPSMIKMYDYVLFIP